MMTRENATAIGEAAKSAAIEALKLISETGYNTGSTTRNVDSFTIQITICHNDDGIDELEDDVHEWESADRFRMWAGQGLPVAWARAMGVETAVVYPITDSTSCGVIDGGPKPEQVLCWCTSREKAVFVIDALRKEHDMDIRR